MRLLTLQKFGFKTQIQFQKGKITTFWDATL
jgi:hypothetical protein